jgi:hypothetical protein
MKYIPYIWLMFGAKIKIICKRVSWEKEKKRRKSLILVKIIEHWTPLGYYYYKYIIKGVFYLPVPQPLKLWKIKFENCWILFTKINK